MLDLAELSFAYPEGDFRLSLPELHVGTGEKVAVIGPSGTGKTTLLKLVAGIVRVRKGRITLDGVRVDGLTDRERRGLRARRIGFIFQDFALLDYLSARENILYPFRIGVGLRLDAAARNRAEALAAACGIKCKLDPPPSALSRGEQQRVAICRALVTQPSLLLADEATGNLDPVTKGVILDLLFERADEAGATLLAVTHDYELLPRFDRVIDFAAFQAPGAEKAT